MSLAPGDVVTLARRGERWQVGAVLGEGGQGTVYRLLSPDGRDLALKWYRRGATQRGQRDALLALIDRAAPSSGFLWPLDLVDSDDGGFGYAMPLRPGGYVTLTDLLTGRVDAPFSVVVRLALSLAHEFLQLHAQGLCYRDISLGNVFFEATTGRVLICDNDNVGVDGDSEARVLGTARFMAPEIVRGEAHPSTATDLFSLAVLVFYVLMVHHPLMGRAELAHPSLDAAADLELFGTRPRFVFDPVDDANAPDPVEHAGVLRMWELYPGFVRAEFVRAFTVGLHDPGARVREGVWRARMARLLDGIVRCACDRENFSSEGHTFAPCWGCGRRVEVPVVLRTTGSLLVLNAGTLVTSHHVRHDYDYDTVLGRVVRHPERPGVWGLQNASSDDWTVTVAGEVRVVEPGRSVGLVPGTRVELGPRSVGELLRP
jgi:DNA-binding helix-hairpin-helix protein with protein kinase domain